MMTRRPRSAVAAVAVGLLAVASTTAQRAPDEEYRVAFAPAAQLERRLNELGRDGFACVALARPEPGAHVPGVAAILARVAATTASASQHRVLGGGHEYLKTLLTKNGADAFRLCDVVLDEEPPGRGVVAVMARTSAETWQYDTEVLLRYKESLARLNSIGRDGFVPVGSGTHRQ